MRETITVTAEDGGGNGPDRVSPARFVTAAVRVREAGTLRHKQPQILSLDQLDWLTCC